MVCSSSVRAPGTVMTAVEVMHLLAAAWHPPHSQSALKTCPEREEMSPPASTWAWGRALAQCRHCDLSRFPASTSASKWCVRGWQELVVLEQEWVSQG